MDINRLRNQDLQGFRPGDIIPPEILQQPHWTGSSPELANYSGKLRGLMTFIENYFWNEYHSPIKVLCTQKDYGIHITVGAEAASILSQRACNSVRNLRSINTKMTSQVDRRSMTPEEQRRHDQAKQRLQLQIEALDRADTTYSYTQQKSAVRQTQKQSVQSES